MAPSLIESWQLQLDTKKVAIWNTVRSSCDSVRINAGWLGRAKMALVSGVTFIATFLVLLTVSNSNDYSVPIEQAAPLFLVLVALAASGYMNLENSGE